MKPILNKIKVIAINIGVNDSIKLVNETKNEFGLTMPIAIDTSGDLAQAFNLIGTPFHVLIDKKGNIIHTGFDASSELDKKIEFLSTNNSTNQKEVSLQSNETIKSPPQFNDLQKKDTILFFVATWCDWYLKESRPDISTRCINAQNTINTLYKKFPEYNWVGVVSRLWTGDEELKKYSEKYNISHPLAIDISNELFFKYKVKNFPTLIVLNNGKQVLRINEFNDIEYLANKLKQYKQGARE